MYTKDEIQKLEKEWSENPRWKNIIRPYTAEDVVKIRGTFHQEQSLAKAGAEKLWKLLESESFVRALGALTGNQAVQMVQAGLKAIYVSGWQVAADANDNLQTYPDLSLYPYLSMPNLIKRINNALERADQIEHLENKKHTDWFVPMVADAEAGFGGNLNTFELVKSMIQAGASGIHLEDQLSSLKKCGHMGGKVLVPTHQFVHKLISARLAADVLGTPTVIIARTDADSAKMVRADYDHIDEKYLTGQTSPDGYYYLEGGIPYAIDRGLEYAPYADLIWCETSTPDLGQAREFAEGIHEKHPGKWLAYNCSPSFNWKSHLGENEMLHFQEKLSEMGYKFQFVTLAGFHANNAAMFELAHGYQQRGMHAYSELQEHEFELEKKHGYQAIKHQHFVGASYFDEVSRIISEGDTSTSSMHDSTEEQQFT